MLVWDSPELRMLHAGGHIAHVASALGQLEIIAPEGIKSYIRGAKSVQELVDMPYPADELAKVRAEASVFPISTSLPTVGHDCSHRSASAHLSGAAITQCAVAVVNRTPRTQSLHRRRCVLPTQRVLGHDSRPPWHNTVDRSDSLRAH